MDTGDGKFKMLIADEDKLEEAKKLMEQAHLNHGGWFTVGEVIEIRGSKFRIKSVKPTELRLKLLPRK